MILLSSYVKSASKESINSLCKVILMVVIWKKMIIKKLFRSTGCLSMLVECDLFWVPLLFFFSPFLLVSLCLLLLELVLPELLSPCVPFPSVPPYISDKYNISIYAKYSYYITSFSLQAVSVVLVPSVFSVVTFVALVLSGFSPTKRHHNVATISIEI